MNGWVILLLFLLVQPLLWLGIGALMTWFGDDE